jgi:alpha-galactosidase
MGQIKNLPLGAVVETNALFRKDSVSPILAGELKPEINSLVLRHVMNGEALLKAALKKDKASAYNVFANDPLVTISHEDAKVLFDEMLYNTKEYLPDWDL